MSDFLARLGARQTSALTIRPRTVSHFESADISPTAWRPANISSDSVDAPVSATSAQSATAAQTESGSTVAARGSDQQPNSSSITNEFRAAHATRETDMEQRLRDLLNGVERMAVERQRVDGPARGYNSVKPIAATPRGEAESTLHRDSVHATITGATTITPRVAAIPSMRSQRDAARMDIGSTPREPDVVHVHIGRVEVRAVHPAPERTRTRNQNGAEGARPLSLEKYLGARELK